MDEVAETGRGGDQRPAVRPCLPVVGEVEHQQYEPDGGDDRAWHGEPGGVTLAHEGDSQQNEAGDDHEQRPCDVTDVDPSAEDEQQSEDDEYDSSYLPAVCHQ